MTKRRKPNFGSSVAAHTITFKNDTRLARRLSEIVVVAATDKQCEVAHGAYEELLKRIGRAEAHVASGGSRQVATSKHGLVGYDAAYGALKRFCGYKRSRQPDEIER